MRVSPSTPRVPPVPAAKPVPPAVAKTELAPRGTKAMPGKQKQHRDAMLDQTSLPEAGGNRQLIQEEFLKATAARDADGGGIVLAEALLGVALLERQLAAAGEAAQLPAKAGIDHREGVTEGDGTIGRTRGPAVPVGIGLLGQC